MKLDTRDGVAVLSMNSGKANAINRDWLTAMESLLAELERAPASSCAVVVTGYDTFFSGGLDLPSLVDVPRAELTTFMERFSAVMLRLFLHPRPVVAALNGHAIAGGCVLALQADERLMADAALKIGVNEVVLGIGLPALVVETLRCQVPASSLVPVALEGKLFAPRDAQALGLVQSVVAPPELLDRAIARARELGALPRPAFAQVKALLRGPVAAAIRAEESRGELARWLDTWFAPAGQERVRAAVARLTKKK